VSGKSLKNDVWADGEGMNLQLIEYYSSHMYRRIVMRLLLLIALLVAMPAVMLHGQGHAGSPLTDARDGQTYRTVVIGTQTWMAENLNIGSVIPSNAPGSLMKDNGVIEKYCWGDDEGNCDGTGGVMKRGGFYEWQEAMQYWNGQPSLPVQGICPQGWHIPSNSEWNTLLNYLGGAGAYAVLNDGGASGFDALMTGYRCTMNGGFRVSAMSSDTRTYFWTAEQTDAGNAPFIELGKNSLQAISFQKSIGLCVRCVKDAVNSTGRLDVPQDLTIHSLTVSSQRLLTVRYTAQAGVLDVIVADILGRVLYQGTRQALPGDNVLQIDLGNAAAGTCIIRLSAHGQVEARMLQFP
jgi:uncharacterized protein (TIGR02145 family)